MFNIVLYEPEIPANTGNVIRLCANTGCALHLVHPLGFEMDDKRLRRAGLDYHEFVGIEQHASWSTCLDFFAGKRLFTVSTRAEQHYDAPIYQPGDVFVFGPETRGLPQALLDTFPAAQKLRLPMQPHSRSLNLSNTVSVLVYEAWRQQGFLNGK